MRFFKAAFAATAVVCSLNACSSESSTPSSGTSETPPAESSSGASSSGDAAASTSDGSSSGASGSSSGGSSSGGSSSGGSSSGGSSSGGPLTCTPPAITSATLGAASAADKTLLCDYAACPFGGYGKSKSCAGGVTVKAKASAAACTGEPTWTKCAALPVSDFLACQGKLNADPCKALETLTQDADCATLKACAF